MAAGDVAWVDALINPWGDPVATLLGPVLPIPWSDGAVSQTATNATTTVAATAATNGTATRAMAVPNRDRLRRPTRSRQVGRSRRWGGRCQSCVTPRTRAASSASSGPAGSWLRELGSRVIGSPRRPGGAAGGRQVGRWFGWVGGVCGQAGTERGLGTAQDRADVSGRRTQEASDLCVVVAIDVAQDEGGAG